MIHATVFKGMMPAAVLCATIIGCMPQGSRAADVVYAAVLPAFGFCYYL